MVRPLGQRNLNEALEANGILPNPAWVRVGDFQFESGYRLAQDLMQAAERVTAIYAGSDIMGLGVLRALQELRIRVPEDVALVSGTGLSLSGWVTPALTAVELPARELGVRAAQLLLDRLRGEQSPPIPGRRVTLAPKLVIRDSCGAKGQVTES